MTDPRLNSLHLEPVRREEFRRAREMLLQARGQHTICADKIKEEDSFETSHTLIHGTDRALASQLPCWLADGEFIYPLKMGVNTVGRSNDNDLVVDDGFISRRHCAILVHSSGSVELHDIASKNGTYINGHRVQGPTTLKSGDEIRISNQQFIFMKRSGAKGNPNPLATLSG
jgi:hypothetical protein